MAEWIGDFDGMRREVERLGREQEALRVGRGARHDFAFSNGWRPYLGGGVFVQPGYWRDATGVVHLEGLLDKNGGNWAVEVIATLAVGFRPAGVSIHGVACSGPTFGFGRIDVDPDGSVRLVLGAPTNPVSYLSLDGITFGAPR